MTEMKPNERLHCGFEVEPPFPLHPLPKDTKHKINEDGTITPILPNETKEMVDE